jgi:hypothetical protein
MEPIRMELEGYSCPCPGTPHSAEWVDLEPAVTIPMGMAAMAVIQGSSATTEPELYGEIAPILLRFGIRRWSFTDEHKNREPIHVDSIARLLPFAAIGYEVTNRCMGLYLGDLMRPLAVRASKRLVPGPMEPTTSPIPASGPRPPSSRSRSSRKSTAGPTSEGLAP